MENPAIARILLKTTRINRSAAGTSDEKRENVLISRKPPPLAVFVCRGYNDMRQRNQTRRAGDAGDKAARTCRKADAALSAVHRGAQTRLYRQQWRSPKRGAVKAEVRCGTDCRYIHRRRKRCEGGAAIAGRPSAPSSQPPQHGAQARLHALRNRYPAQTRPSLYARAQRQAARRHCKVNEGFCASRKLFRRFAVRLAVGRRLYSDFPVLSSTGALLIKSYPAALFRSTA